MSTFTVALEISHPNGTGSSWQLVPDAVVDTGADYSQVPRALLTALGIEAHRRDPFVLADGRVVESDVGRALFRIQGREEVSLVSFVADDEPILLGAHTLESLLLGVDPHGHRLIPVPGRRFSRRLV